MSPDRVLDEMTGMYGQDQIGLSQAFHSMIQIMLEEVNVRDPCMQPILTRMGNLVSRARIPRALLPPLPEDRIRRPRL